MCGFLGEFVFQNELSTKNVFESLLELSKHRGPDATLITKQKKFQLGFNRLAILDLSAKGHQPKTSPSGRYHVVFNGEIYNYKTLSKTYNLNQLTSTSDTEVIVHLLDKIGITKTLSLLNGMFAIAIIDTVDQRISLSRDFAGIKPLFYGLNSEGLVFASQFDQIFKHPWFKGQLQLRNDVVKDYFGFGYMQAPNTIYQNIHQVKPGELITIGYQGQVKKQFFCTYNKPLTPTQEEDKCAVQTMDRLLKQVIKQQLASDVSVGTFLSGGIDSPLVTSYAKTVLPDIEAFTIKVNDPKLNESEIATQYAKHLNLKHQILDVNETDLLQAIDEHFEAFCEPFGDYSSIPTYLLTKKGKPYHTVLLSGDGGDELFWGYPRMLDIVKKRPWFYVPKWLRRPLVRLSNTLKITNTWAPYFPNMENFVMSKQLHIPNDQLDSMVPTCNFSKELEALYHVNYSTKKKKLLLQLRTNEFYGHLQRVLIKVDRASMKNSVEVRVPLLDKRIIDFAWSVSPGLGNKHNILKKILKDTLKLVIPESITTTKKKGFSVPVLDWLRHDLKTDVFYHIFERPFYGSDIMDIKAIQDYVRDFYDYKHDNAWGIWHIYAWQKWAYTHLDFKF